MNIVDTVSTFDQNKQIFESAAAKTAHYVAYLLIAIILMTMVAFLPAGVGFLVFLLFWKPIHFASWYFSYRWLLFSSKAGLDSRDRYDAWEEKVTKKVSPILSLYQQSSKIISSPPSSP